MPRDLSPRLPDIQLTLLCRHPADVSECPGHDGVIGSFEFAPRLQQAALDHLDFGQKLATARSVKSGIVRRGIRWLSTGDGFALACQSLVQQGLGAGDVTACDQTIGDVEQRRDGSRIIGSQ